jgi:hypothetical protein
MGDRSVSDDVGEGWFKQLEAAARRAHDPRAFVTYRYS